MKELLEYILKYIPSYIQEFVGLLKGPKTFILEHLEKENVFKNSLIFAGISFCLIFILKGIGRIEEASVQQVFIGNFVLDLLGYMVLALYMVLAWKIVRAKPVNVAIKGNQEILTTFAYMYGIIILLEGVFHLTSMGVLKMLDPVLYQVMQQLGEVGNGNDLKVLIQEHKEAFANATQEQLDLRASAMTMMQNIGVLRDVVILAWIILIWGTYRQICAVGKGKSIAALLLFLVLEELDPFVLFKVFVEKAMG